MVEEWGIKPKILLLSLIGRKFNQNYGAVLQAYALERFLSKNEYQPNYLDFNPIEKKKTVSVNIKHAIRNYGILRTIKKAIKKAVIVIFTKRKMKRLIELRKGNFAIFVNRFISFSEKSYNSYSDLKRESTEICKTYDVF